MCGNVKSVRFLGKDTAVRIAGYSIFACMPNLQKDICNSRMCWRHTRAAYAGLVPDSGGVVYGSVGTCRRLNAKAAHVYSHTVHLTWDPVQNDLLDGYQVYRDGTEEENLLTEKVLKDASYTDEQLEIGESHTYYVRGCLTDGRKSEFAQITAGYGCS